MKLLYPLCTVTILFCILALPAAAVPVDLANTTSRDIVIETVSNACDTGTLCDAPGVYASDPAATFRTVEVGATLTFSEGIALISISAAAWADELITLYGESTDPADPGIVRDAISSNVIAIDVATGLNTTSGFNWSGPIVIGGLEVAVAGQATGGGILSEVDSDYGATPGTNRSTTPTPSRWPTRRSHVQGPCLLPRQTVSRRTSGVQKRMTHRRTRSRSWARSRVA